MTQAIYDAVLLLVDQLTPEQKQNLIAHLQTVSKQRELSFEEWEALLETLRGDTRLTCSYSDRRVDWYDDDGRS